MSEMATYARMRLALHYEICEAPKGVPEVDAKVVHAFGYESIGNAMNMLEVREEDIQNATSLLFNLMLEATGASDCEVGATIRDAANELIPEGC